MRTGRFRFATKRVEGGWFKRGRPVQVLLVEVEEPVNAQGDRATFWVEGNISDACTVEARFRAAEGRV